MWTGATDALKEGLTNAAFLRTNIEIIDRFFAPGEVSERMSSTLLLEAASSSWIL
jgi:hypothetical protein